MQHNSLSSGFKQKHNVEKSGPTIRTYGYISMR